MNGWGSFPSYCEIGPRPPVRAALRARFGGVRRAGLATLRCLSQPTLCGNKGADEGRSRPFDPRKPALRRQVAARGLAPPPGCARSDRGGRDVRPRPRRPRRQRRGRRHARPRPCLPRRIVPAACAGRGPLAGAVVSYAPRGKLGVQGGRGVPLARPQSVQRCVGWLTVSRSGRSGRHQPCGADRPGRRSERCERGSGWLSATRPPPQCGRPGVYFKPSAQR